MLARKQLRKNKTPVRLARVADGVVVSFSDPLCDRPVLGAILGDDEVLMVDAGASPAHARSFVEELKALTGRKPTMVCISHWHWDHSFGLSALGIPSFAHPRCVEALERLRDLEWTSEALASRVIGSSELAFTRDMILAEYGAEPEVSIAIPNNVIENYRVFELGGRSVSVLHIEADHSDDSLVVLDGKSGVAFVGDICHPDYYAKPIRYSPARALALLDRLEGMDAAVFVEGHEEPQDRARFFSAHAALRAVASAVLDGERSRVRLLELAYASSPGESRRELRAMVHAMLCGASAGPAR